MLESHEVRLLADVGFIAISHGLDQQAMAIFDGLTAARPEQEAGRIGIALVHLLRGEASQAVTILKTLPPSDAALTFLALARSRTGEIAAARELLDDVIRTGGDVAYVSLARDIQGALKA